jgi:hypothetical protein
MMGLNSRSTKKISEMMRHPFVNTADEPLFIRVAVGHDGNTNSEQNYQGDLALYQTTGYFS